MSFTENESYKHKMAKEVLKKWFEDKKKMIICVLVSISIAI